MQPRGNYDCYFMVSGRPLVYTLGALSWVGFWASWNPGNYRLAIGGMRGTEQIYKDLFNLYPVIIFLDAWRWQKARRC